MDSKKKTSLDALLNQVRQGKPVWEKDEAMNWLREKESLPLTKSRSTLKPIIMTSILVSIGVALTLWLTPTTPKNNVSVSQRAADQKIPSSKPGESPVHQNGASLKPKTTTRDTRAKMTESETPSRVYAESPKPEPLPIPIDTPQIDTLRIVRVVNQETTENTGDSAKEMKQLEAVSIQKGAGLPCLPFSGTLKLGAADLKKLGIIQSENSLLLQQEHTSEGKFQLVMKGVNDMSQTSSITGFTSKKNNDLLPLAVIGCQGNWAYKRENIQGLEQLKSAIALELTLHDGSVVFFYEPKSKLLSVLPAAIQAELKAEPLRYSLSNPQAFERLKILSSLQDRGPAIALEPEEELFKLEQHLQRLDIAVTEQGFELKRDKIEIKHESRGMRINSWRTVRENDLRTETKVDDLLPLYVTGATFYSGFPVQMGSILPSLNDQEEQVDMQSKFLFDKWSLIPMVLEHPKSGRFIFWYAYSPALQELLSEEENAKAKERLSKVNQTFQYTGAQPSFVNVDDLFVEELPEKDALNAIEPAKSVLKRLGIEVNEQGHIEVNMPYGKSSMMTNVFSKNGTEILLTQEAEDANDLEDRKRQKTAFDALVSITDDMGRNPRLNRWMEEGVELNKLIPVRVRSGQSFSLDDKINQRWRPDIILWYMPTPEVLALIESETDTVYSGVVTSVNEVNVETQASCRYTEICRNKTGVFSEHKLFPNPASGSCQFSWTSSEATAYRINLYALNGQKVKRYEGLQSLAGENTYSLNLSGLAPGVYMVILHSDKGDEIHERLVVKP